MTVTNGIDINRARRETPGSQNLIHLNNAGASLMPQPVLEAVVNHLQLETEAGGYEAAEQQTPSMQNFYTAAATLLNCAPHEIARFETTTDAWATACHALILGRKIGEGDRILVGESEYVNNYISLLQLASRHGFSIQPIPVGEDGAIDPVALANMIDPTVKLISLTHAPANGGLINPAAKIGAIAKDAGIPFILDAAQTTGQVPLDIPELGCDMLVAAGRKYLRGPRGTGFLYASTEILPDLELPVLNTMGVSLTPDHQVNQSTGIDRFEVWQPNPATQIGLGRAIDYALEWGLETIRDRIALLSTHLRGNLGSMKDVKLRDLGTVKSGIVCCSLEKQHPADIERVLKSRNINTATINPAMTFIDSSTRQLPPLLRASVHYYNTVEELDSFCAALEQALG